jgi:pSer/pThr/pTyr-binding forkhead associated (FHA) protein
MSTNFFTRLEVDIADLVPFFVSPQTCKKLYLKISYRKSGGQEKVLFVEINDSISGSMFVGRNRLLSDICVGDRFVSRQHLWIGWRKRRVFVQDLGSTNGTFLNGGFIAQDIPEGEKRRLIGDFYELYFGDVLIIGKGVKIEITTKQI